MARRFGEAIGLSWLLVPATAALMMSAVSMAHHGWTGLTLQGDRVVHVEPEGPGARAGVRPGDRLARPGEDPGLLDPTPLAHATPGVPLVLERRRLEGAVPVWIVPEPSPESERRFKTLLFAVATGFLLLGGWVWSERRDRLTAIFFLLCLAFAGWLAPSPRLEGGWSIVYQLSLLVVQLFIPALFSHFFALFPEPGARPRARGWVRALYGIGVLSLVLWAAMLVEDQWGPGRMAGLARDGLTVLAGLALAAGFLGGVVLFGWALARAADRDARRRLRVAFVGTLLGMAPFALMVALRNTAPHFALPGERLAVLATLLMPASFAWAIAVHRIFDFRVALRAITALAAAAVVAGGLYLGGEWVGRNVWPAAGAGVTGVALAFLALVASLAGPVRPLLSSLGERVVPIAGERTLGGWAPSPESSRADGPEQALGEACAAVRQSLRLDGCAAAMLRSGRLDVVAHDGSHMMPALDPGFLEALARVRGPVPLAEAPLAEADRESLEMSGVHWLLPVPGQPAPAGLLMGRRLAGAWLDRRETLDLTHVAERLAITLEHLDLARERRSHGVLARELAEAHKVQMHRLPRRLPVLPTLDCAALTLSTEVVGGDYYDVVELGPREFMLAVGDAAGHGVAAALVMAGVQARFRDEAQRLRQPSSLLEALNRDLVALEQPDKFMALLCARVDAAGATVRFANAGVGPVMVRRADGRFEERREGGILLGVQPQARYEVSSIELQAGDVVVLATDGLVEASRAGDLLGVEGVAAVLDRSAHRRAADILEDLLRTVRAHADGPLDDLTIVVLKQLARPAGRTHGQAGLKSRGPAAEKSG